MPSSKLKDALRIGGLAAIALAVIASLARAAERDRISIPVGRGEVVTSAEDVRTVAIAEPMIADAAVGSARTVVVNAKTPGVTTLVVYAESGHFRIYDVEVYQPNSDKQVKLNIHLSELSQAALRELGLDWQAHGNTSVRWIDGSVSGGLSTSPPGTLPDAFLDYVRNDGTLRFQTKWKALEQKGDIRTLARPSLLASSGQKASFHSGGEFPIVSASTGTVVSTGGGAISSQGVFWKEFGVKVDFVPLVRDDGTIQLDVTPEVSQLDFTRVINGYPTVLTNKAKTSVHLRSGEYLVIGGLKLNEKNKRVRRVPILGQIPLLGALFTNVRNEVNEKELLIVVSPEMVEAAATKLPELPTDRPEKK